MWNYRRMLLTGRSKARSYKAPMFTGTSSIIEHNLQMPCQLFGRKPQLNCATRTDV